MAKTKGRAAVPPPRPDAIRPMDLHACCVVAIREHTKAQRGADGDQLTCGVCGGVARFVRGAWQYGGGAARRRNQADAPTGL